MTLNGTLEDFSPAGILKVLSTDGRTGAVRFGGPHGCTVYLHRGQLYFARNEATDAALATALVRPGRLSADGWGHAIDEAGDRPVVGELLVRNGAITSDLLASVVLSVVYDPLIDLFRDGTGEFDFEPDTVHWLGPFRAFPVDAIVNEVRKRVREVDEWSTAIPSLDSWVEASRTLPGNAAQVTILREDWELVTALSGPRTIRELATELGRGAYSTARVVNRLHQAGLVEVVSTDDDAQVVPIRRAEPEVDEAPAAGLEMEADPLLAMGLPHRTARPRVEEQEPDALTAHIGDAIADALAEPDVDQGAASPSNDLGIDPFSDMFASATDLLGGTAEPVQDLDAVDHERPGLDPFMADPFQADPFASAAPTSTDHSTYAPAESGSDHSDPFADTSAQLHHGEVEAEPVEERPSDPNAAWLEDLYAQFIDEPEAAAVNGAATKKRRRGEPNPVDVAFRIEEQDAEEKVSTLKRLMGALRKL
jgi:hypothetical protein